MPIEIPAAPGRPVQWRYDQLSSWQTGDTLPPGFVSDRILGTNRRSSPADDYGQRALGRGVEQRTDTRLIRLYGQFDYGPNFPQRQRANYPKTEDDELGMSQAWASRWVSRRELLDKTLTGRARPLARVLEELIFGPNATGYIGTLSSVTIANG